LPEAGRSIGDPVVVFDIDGTLLDSATGIIAGFQHALRSVGFEPPDAATLRLDLGPPVGQIFTALGLPAVDLEAAVLAYRAFYLDQGLQQSTPYDGVVDVLEELNAAGVVMATATAKRTEIARAILDHHGLTSHFSVVNGVDEQHHTKTATLGHTLQLLDNPSPGQVVMVGDRHSDITAAENCRVLPVAVTWGYGSLDELQATGAELIDHPSQLFDVPALRQRIGSIAR
jgi:phosphoglycolate phosphatase